MVSIVFVLVAIEDTIFATIENIATVDDGSGDFLVVKSCGLE